MADIMVTVRIPDGDSCREERMCVFAKYSARHNGYNCALYGRLLTGAEVPIKCLPCARYCVKYASEHPAGGDE